MSDKIEKQQTIDDSKEEHYRILLQKIKDLSRFRLIREKDTYKQLSRYFLFKHPDWREEFNKFLHSNILRSLNPALQKVFIDFTEKEFWWALLTDPEYNKNGRLVLFEDYYKWLKEHGTAYQSARADECLKNLSSLHEERKQYFMDKEIGRDEYLLELFKNNKAIYDKFFERCEGKEKINIVIELIAVAIAIKSEDEYTAYLLERGKNLITLHEELSKHFVLAGYASFAKAISEYKSIPKERQYKINNAKKEYQKLLS